MGSTEDAMGRKRISSSASFGTADSWISKWSGEKLGHYEHNSLEKIVREVPKHGELFLLSVVSGMFIPSLKARVV